MASIVKYNCGLKRIEFTRNGRAMVIRLGRVNANVARMWLDKVNAIIADRLAARPHDAEVSKWLGELDEKMLARLRAVGLAEGVGLASTTLGAFLSRYMDAMSAKPATVTFYGHTRRNLEEHFGAGRLLRDIHAADADGWRAWLATHEKLSPATVARRVIAARTMWRKAVRWNLAGANPFAGIKAGHQENDSRKRFIARDVIDKLIAEAPDTEWKLIIALARWGGLRCPSEHFALRWGDVDWERGRFIVHSSKTEHHEGKGTRVVPIFPELRPYLLDAFDQAEPGTEYVIAKHRLGSLNLRQQFKRIIHRAGLTAWPRLFQNLRASRETELMREYDLATACKWIGNSPAVAAKHYAMSVDLDADFRRASGKTQGAEKSAEEAQRNAQMTAEGLACPGMTKGGATAVPTTTSAPPDSGGQSLVTAGKSGEWAIQDSNL